MFQTRQLVAIMFTHLVDFTSLAGNGEERAFDLPKKNREIQNPVIEKYLGKWIKELGVPPTFYTVTDAVICPSSIIKKCEVKRLWLCIRIHHAEMVFNINDKRECLFK